MLLNKAWVIDDKARIGFSVVYADNLVMKNGAKIGNFNKVLGLKRLVLDESAEILTLNSITGSKYFSELGCELVIGKSSLILRSNVIDVTGVVSIGNDVVFAGVSNQLWTHGFDVLRNKVVGNVTIGDCVYIGSSTIINPGVKICNNVLLGVNSVVTKDICISGFYVGSPAKLKNTNNVFLEGSGFKKYKEIDGKSIFIK